MDLQIERWRKPFSSLQDAFVIVFYQTNRNPN